MQFSAPFFIVTSRADTFERGRKEIEHRVMSYEDTIEATEAKIKEARYLTDEATRKYDEATYKMDTMSASLERASGRADRAEATVQELEAQLKSLSDRLTQKLAAKEKGVKREEGMRNQVFTCTMEVKWFFRQP